MALVEDIENAVVTGVDFVTGLPQRGKRELDKLNERLIEVSRNIGSKAEKKARSNLKRQKIQTEARGVVDWVLDNPLIAGGIALVIFIFIRRI